MKKNPLLQYGNVPVTNQMIASCFDELNVPQKKIQALEKSGELIRLRRGLYIVNPELSGKAISGPLCANQIYGPSYVSLHWALRWYGLIPEKVFHMTSVTTKTSKTFETSLGYFYYYKVNKDYFNIGIRMVKENGASYLMASPEKALCDLILYDRHLPDRSVKGLLRYLEDDLRLDMDEFFKFDIGIIEACSEHGRKKSIFKNLTKILKQ